MDQHFMASIKKLLTDTIIKANSLNKSQRGHGVAQKIGELFNYTEKRIFQDRYGIKMNLDTNNWMERSICYNNFESSTRRIILSELKTNGVFIDIGANIGYYTLLAANIIGHDGKVIAFEPNPQTFERLNQNIKINKAFNINSYNIAVSSASESILYVNNDNHTEASFGKDTQFHGETVNIKSEKLDDQIPTLNLKHIDMIKIDVEGAEPLVLRSGVKTLDYFKPKIIMELNPKAVEQLGLKWQESIHILEDIYKITTVQILSGSPKQLMSIRALCNLKFTSINVFVKPNS